MASTAPVVAGVDGSPSSRVAAEHAASAAAARRAPLELVHGYLHPLGYGTLPVDPYAVTVPAPPEQGGRMLAEVADRLRAEHPGLPVQTRQVAGGPAATLIEESRRADLVVVGCRGLGGFAGLLLGSVSAQVAAHAHCPVLVVRPAEPEPAEVNSRPEAGPAAGSGPQPHAGPRPPAGSGPHPAGGSRPEGGPRADAPVLVAVDFSTGSETALTIAADEAVRRGTPLVIANVWWNDPLETMASHPGDDVVSQARTAAAEAMAVAVAATRRRHPTLPVGPRLIHSLNPEHSLVEASREVGLVVVGSRGRGGFGGLLLGSVSQALVHHAHCPVLVAHPHSHRR